MAYDKFNILKSTAVPLPIENVDTDQLIPARFLKATERVGFGDNLFRDWRYNQDNTPKKDFVLNDPAYSGKILVAGKNFGCGSSREHAPWALLDYGFRVIIAPSFADIFYNNCFKNGILPITLRDAEMDELFRRAEANVGYQLTADLPKQTVSDAQGLQFHFDIDDFRKTVLLEGLDDIGMTLKHEPEITAYEQRNHPKATMYEAVDFKQ